MAEPDENFSDFVSKTLNAIGYSWQTIEKRRESIKQIYNMKICSCNNNCSGLSTIYAGSQREGVVKPFEADLDVMHVLKGIIATENVPLFDDQDNLAILQVETDGRPPGYTYLRLAKHGGRWHRDVVGNEKAQQLLQIVEDSCQYLDVDSQYLSSEIFINEIENLINKLPCNIPSPQCLADIVSNRFTVSFSPRSGPSLPKAFDDGITHKDIDNVYSINCHCPRIFERFRNRPRRHGWPPEHVLQELSQLEAHVVPVGHKKSSTPFLEWRICFTKSEIRLIECLTGPQIQAFVLLKIFAKDVLKESWDVMTSYIMKNVILWMVELIPVQKFRTDSIVDRFLDCLFFLKLCLKSGNLPSYMISDRNLLCHSQLSVKRRELLGVLDHCLQEKGSCLLMSGRLRDSMVKMYREPQWMKECGIKRDKLANFQMSCVQRIGPTLRCPLVFSLQTVHENCTELSKLMLEDLDGAELLSDPLGVLQRYLKYIVIPAIKF